MINIQGLDKAEVLSALFNSSKMQGLNIQLVNMGMRDYPKPMTKEEAQSILDKRGEQKYFDYLNGKVMKVDITNDEFREWGYDRDNGEGAAQRAVDTLR